VKRKHALIERHIEKHTGGGGVGKKLIGFYLVKTTAYSSTFYNR